MVLRGAADLGLPSYHRAEYTEKGDLDLVQPFRVFGALTYYLIDININKALRVFGALAEYKYKYKESPPRLPGTG